VLHKPIHAAVCTLYYLKSFKLNSRPFAQLAVAVFLESIQSEKMPHIPHFISGN